MILSDIRDAVASVRQIVARAEDEWRAYHLEGGQLKVMTRYMRAGIPVMFDGELIIPAQDFEKTIKTLRSDPEVIVGPKEIVFRAGKARVTVPRFESEDRVKVERLEGATVDLDEAFMTCLRAVFPLIEDVDTPDWQNSVICIDGQIITTHRGQVLICTHYEPFKIAKIKGLFPVDLVRFILNKKAPPKEMILSKANVQFVWPDDSWVISTLIAGNVPARLFHLVNELKEPEWEITDEHREAIKDIIAMGGTEATFDETGAWTELDRGRFDTGVTFPLAAGGTSKWSTKHLVTALAIGRCFDFARYPDPAYFSGEGVRGMMAGMMV